MKNKLLTWERELSKREQILILVLTALLFLGVYYFFAVKPVVLAKEQNVSEGRTFEERWKDWELMEENQAGSGKVYVFRGRTENPAIPLLASDETYELKDEDGLTTLTLVKGDVPKDYFTASHTTTGGTPSYSAPGSGTAGTTTPQGAAQPSHGAVNAGNASGSTGTTGTVSASGSSATKSTVPLTLSPVKPSTAKKPQSTMPKSNSITVTQGGTAIKPKYTAPKTKPTTLKPVSPVKTTPKTTTPTVPSTGTATTPPPPVKVNPVAPSEGVVSPKATVSSGETSSSVVEAKESEGEAPEPEAEENTATDPGSHEKKGTLTQWNTYFYENMDVSIGGMAVPPELTIFDKGHGLRAVYHRTQNDLEEFVEIRWEKPLYGEEVRFNTFGDPQGTLYAIVEGEEGTVYLREGVSTEDTIEFSLENEAVIGIQFYPNAPSGTLFLGEPEVLIAEP